MAVDSALLYDIRTLAAKIETTTGTAISLSGSDGAVNAFDTDFKADIPPTERQGQGSLSALPIIPGPRSGTASFKTEIVGNGTTGDPFWLATLLAACSFQVNTGTWTPKSGGSTTITLGSYINGRLKQIAGAMGKVSIDFEAGKPAMASWEFTGVWQPPTAVSIISPTYPTVIPPRFAGATLTFGGTAYKIGKMTLNIENTVVLRQDAAHVSGHHAAVVTKRKITLKVSPEALPLGTKDWYADHLATNTAAWNCVLGSTGNNTITFTAPTLTLLNPPQDENDNGIYRDGLEFLLAEGSGFDTELTIAAT